MKKKDSLSSYIIFNIVFILVFSFIREVFNMPHSDLGKMMVFFSIVNIIISIVVFAKRKSKLKIYDVLILLIILFLIIVTIFARNVSVSLFGTGGRYEGLFSLIYYLTLLVISSFVSKDKKKNIVNVIIGTGIIHVLYGLTHMNYNMVTNNPTWVNGLTTNPNFLGTYMLLCLSCSMGMFILDNDKKFNIIYGITTMLLLVGLLISNTTSCLLGFVVVFIYLLIHLIRNKKFDKLVALLSIIIFTTTVVYIFDGTTLFNDLIKTKSEVVNISNGKSEKDYGTHRITIWKKTLDIVPKNIIHGVGIDNFLYAFDDGPIVIRKYRYDKAHNDYLQILICEGIFTLISYLLLYIIIVLKSIKKKKLYLLLPVIGYLIQAFFNISVIEVAPIFFILLGLLIDRDEDVSIYRSYIKRLLDIVFSIILLIILLPVLIIISISIIVIDRNNIFYKQERTGKNGKIFNIYKFKTIKNKKITKIGNILRKTS